MRTPSVSLIFSKQQQAAASSSQQQPASSNVVNPWQRSDVGIFGKLLRGDESSSNVFFFKKSL